MSRAQEGQNFNTATDQNSAYTKNAQTAFTQEQNDVNQGQADVGTYQAMLAKFAGRNPYVQGGEYATTQNQGLTDIANAGAGATEQELQSAAVHGGVNPAQAIAGSEEVAQKNQRTLGEQLAEANQKRITGEAGYNERTLGGYQTAAGLQDAITGQQGGLAKDQGELGQQALATAQKAGMTPSFGDELGSTLLKAGEGAASIAFAGCWIAAELWDGWEDERVKLVRRWLATEFSRSWHGALLVWIYMRWGERIAKRIQTRKRLRSCFAWLFGRALVSAQKWREGLERRGEPWPEIARKSWLTEVR